MERSDLVAIADAYFLVHRIGKYAVDVAAGSPRATQAICSVLALDDEDLCALMDPGSGWKGVTAVGQLGPLLRRPHLRAAAGQPKEAIQLRAPDPLPTTPPNYTF